MHLILNYFKSKKQFHIKAFGSSMFPLFLPDDILYFKKTTFSGLRVNDVILVYKSNRSFTHRIIYKGERYLVTKGDNNLDSDGKIYPLQIMGKVYQIKRNRQTPNQNKYGSGQVFNPEDIYLLQSTLYFGEILDIKKEFEKKCVDFVFLKGLPLHLYLEKSHPRRIYADCDVLINTKDWQPANKILEQCGYRQANTSFSIFHKLLKDKETEFSYFRHVNNFPVQFDIHLEVAFLMNQIGRLEALYSQKLIDQITEQFLKEKKYVKIQNEYFPILSPANLIIYLSLHFFHHNFRGIFRLEILHKIIRKSLPIPEAYLSLARKILNYRLQNFVYPVFSLLEKYYGLKLPKIFLDNIKPTDYRLRYLKTNILNVNIFDEEARTAAGINRFKNIFFLSENPLYKKVIIFINPSVIYTILWLGIRKIIRRAKLFSFLKAVPGAPWYRF